MSKYSKTGSYAGYDRNNKEREALDYYATPVKEVENIIEKLNLQNFSGTVLEPCCGGGHMVEGIIKAMPAAEIYATDIKERDNDFLSQHIEKGVHYNWGNDCDFLSENYPISSKELVIMNPPFKVIIPFILHGLKLADNYLICFGRLKTVEGKERYEKVFSKTPPTHIYQYIDRVSCGKNGEFDNKNGVEAHAWFVWDKKIMAKNPSYNTIFNWIHSK